MEAPHNKHEQPFLLIKCGLDVELFCPMCLPNVLELPRWDFRLRNTETRMNFGAAAVVKMVVKGCFKEGP